MARKHYYYDLQVHTARYSPCSTLPPEKLIDEARRRGLDGVALTEHDYCWLPEEVAELKEQARRREFTILVGCEVRTMTEDRMTGDLLVFGLAQAPSGSFTIDRLCREVHARGGIVIAPHPYAESYGLGDEIYTAPVDAVEVYNYRYRGERRMVEAERACRKAGLAGTAGSDAHGVGEVGRYCTEFDVPIRNETELIEAILNHQCRPRRKSPPFRLSNWF